MSSSDDASSIGSSSSAAEDEFANYNDVTPPKKKARTVQPPPMKALEQAPAFRSIDQQRMDALKSRRKIIILLDQASLETVKNRRGMLELLNCDDHRDICIKKLRRDPKEFRPDICHQELLTLLDSPLNKSGSLQVYVRTSKNVLIEINQSIRIPRTYKRFSGLIVQLLYKMKIKAKNSSTTLMKLIKNPFSQHLPSGTRAYGMSCKGIIYSPYNLAKEILPPDPYSTDSPTLCLVVGAMATGHVTVEDHPYIEKMISVSEYPLSGATALSRMLGGMEHHWGII